MLYVRQLALGPMKNFVYLVGAEGAPEVAVIDPAWDVPAIFDAAEQDGKKVSAAVVSHHHHDHINGLPALLARADVPVYAQKAELDFSEELQEHRSAIRAVGPGEAVKVGPLELKLIHTPGHTPGSQCVYCGGALVSGDTVFVNACGRCDFPGGSAEQMFDSLHRVLGGLPGETKLFPGHDYGDVQVSSLDRERQQNPYFKLGAVGEFLAYRMRPRK
ncbi:MAG: MBL fold metallo-hydrolase [Archangiaceae bacterium]|nr:MBL fold metallo-hydrolase [Archangiaceae bacterium]